MSDRQKIRVLFVCMGNICRSPAAEGTFRHVVKARNLVKQFEIDSAGTLGFHAGDPANSNAQKAAARHGIKLESLARQFTATDFEQFDYIFTMDSNNRQEVLALARTASDREKVYMFRQFDPKATGKEVPDVPDPYYGGMSGFDEVQNIMLRTSEALLDWFVEKYGARESDENEI